MVYFGDNVRGVIWGFSGKAKDCQDICAMIQECVAFSWQDWMCRIVRTIWKKVCEDGAISGRIVDEKTNGTSRISIYCNVLRLVLN